MQLDLISGDAADSSFLNVLSCTGWEMGVYSVCVCVEGQWDCCWDAHLSPKGNEIWMTAQEQSINPPWSQDGVTHTHTLACGSDVALFHTVPLCGEVAESDTSISTALYLYLTFITWNPSDAMCACVVIRVRRDLEKPAYIKRRDCGSEHPHSNTISTRVYAVSYWPYWTTKQNESKKPRQLEWLMNNDFSAR